jgi:serine/threonine protein kinase
MGSLLKVLSNARVSVTYNLLLKMAFDTSLAIKFLFENEIVHGDLKSGNLLVTINGNDSNIRSTLSTIMMTLPLK